MNFSFLEEQVKRFDLESFPERTLGKALQSPFNPSNSSPRKQMFNTHNTQHLQVLHAEVPYISTGYENKYGELSSCFVKNNADYQIIAKIPKFSKHKDHIYYLVYFDTELQKYDMFEVKPYEYISEIYGWMINNSELDKYKPGDFIPKDTVMTKSITYDEYNNKEDGVNLLTAYAAVDDTKEDSIIISESAQKKLSSPLFKCVEIIINENDIPKNSYGDNTTYKFMPDLLEYTKSKFLCGIRRQKNDEAIYSQAEFRLSKNQFEDDNFITEGQVVDIDIFCNNTKRLGTTSYDDQLKFYYDEKLRLCHDIITLVDQLGGTSVAGPNLQRMYERCKDVVMEVPSRNQNTTTKFSNIYLKIVVLNRAPILKSDKLSNRYGGKGVISKILPDEQMGYTQDGRPIDIIETKNTVIGRENIGQLWEMHINHISHAIILYMRDIISSDFEECFNLYMKFISMVSPEFAEYVRSMYPNQPDGFTDQDWEMFYNSVVEDDYIYVPLNPIRDNMTIDKLRDLYREFPMAKAEQLLVPIVNSNGELEYVLGARPVVVSMVYYYRLKQIGEEKMSATSLSPINTKGLNTKSNAAKLGKTTTKSTAVSLTRMEMAELLNSGISHNIIAQLMYSVSVKGRRQCRQLLTNDPINPNILLPEDASNRQAEIFNAYLKTKGMRIRITKYKKPTVDPFLIDPFIVNTTMIR